jgi:DNA-3-methyladenine glycosylase
MGTKITLKKLCRDFYDRDTTTVAQELLGKLLVKTNQGITSIGKIVEVEAYIGPHDLACHVSKGCTPRTKVMFGPPGHAYVYLIYGIYHCLNVVTEQEGYPAAVLIRALEPIQNLTERTSGPGLLCKAMQIDKTYNTQDLTSDEFYIARSDTTDHFPIVKKARIGVDYAGEWSKKLLRFYIQDNPFISKK